LTADGDSSAILHFCKVMDRIRFDDFAALRASLRLDIDPQYEDIVDIIPFEQITSVETEPIGRGERGIVYKGTWSCPQKTSMASPKNISVAIKAITSTLDSEKRFLQKVRFPASHTKFGL